MGYRLCLILKLLDVFLNNLTHIIIDEKCFEDVLGLLHTERGTLNHF